MTSQLHMKMPTQVGVCVCVCYLQSKHRQSTGMCRISAAYIHHTARSRPHRRWRTPLGPHTPPRRYRSHCCRKHTRTVYAWVLSHTVRLTHRLKQVMMLQRHACVFYLLHRSCRVRYHVVDWGKGSLTTALGTLTLIPTAYPPNKAVENQQDDVRYSYMSEGTDSFFTLCFRIWRSLIIKQNFKLTTTS